MITGKTIALTLRSFVGKVMSLIFNTLSRFVIAFLPRSKLFCFVLFLNFIAAVPSSVILEPKKMKSFTFFHCFPFICHEVMGLDLCFLNVEF